MRMPHGEPAARAPEQGHNLWLYGAAAALFLYALWRLRQYRRTRPAQDAAAHLRARAEGLLSRHGVAVHPEEGFEDLALRLQHEGHPAAAPLRAVVEAWLGARFGGRALTEPVANALLRPLASALRQPPVSGGQRAA